MLPPGLGFRNGADDLYLDAEPNTKPRPKWETLSKLSNVGFSFYLIGFYGLRDALEELPRWNQSYSCGRLVENKEYENNEGNHNLTPSTYFQKTEMMKFDEKFVAAGISGGF